MCQTRDTIHPDTRLTTPDYPKVKNWEIFFEAAGSLPVNFCQKQIYFLKFYLLHFFFFFFFWAKKLGLQSRLIFTPNMEKKSESAILKVIGIGIRSFFMK